MNEYQEQHRRVLKQIQVQMLGLINSADESVLQALLLTGKISESSPWPGSTARLNLTVEGQRYLIWLEAQQLPSVRQTPKRPSSDGKA